MAFYFLIVMSWQLSVDSVFHILLFVFLSSFSGFYQSATVFLSPLPAPLSFKLVWSTLPLPAHWSLKNGVLAHQLHCCGIRLVTGSNSGGFLTCSLWMCEVNNTGSATTMILISRTFCLELWPCPLGQLDPTILVDSSLQKNNLWTELTYLKSG